MSLNAMLINLAQAMGADVKDLLIQLAGVRPAPGEIREFAGVTAPSGWSIAAGQVLNIADHPALFAAIGNIYGGDGVDTFALPDFRNRVALGASTAHALGTTGGSATVSIGANNLPEHTHAVSSGLTAGTTLQASVGYTGGQTPNAGDFLSGTSGGQSGAAIYAPSGTVGTTVGLGGVATTLTGSVDANTTDHDALDVLPPYLAINRIIYLG
jgi:microcystin-dependent protein